MATRERRETQEVARRETSSAPAMRDPYARSGNWPDSFHQFRRLSDYMDRWFDSLGLGRMSQRPGSFEGAWTGLWAPELETFMRGDQFIIRMDLPGLKADDVNVEVTDDSIRIHGERQQSHDDSQEGWYRSERSYGQFHREVLLPEGAQADTAKASFRDGVLEIAIKAPPRQAAKPRRIAIGTRGATEGEGREMESATNEGMPPSERHAIHGDRPSVAHERTK